MSQRSNLSGNGFTSFGDQQGPPMRGLRLYQMTEVEKCQRLHQLALLHQQKQGELQESTHQVKMVEQEIQEDEKDLAAIEEQIEQLVKIVHQRKKETFESGNGKDSQ